MTIQGAENMKRFTNQEHLKTLDAKRTNPEDDIDLYNGNNLFNAKGATLHETDLFKIAVRNLSE